MRNRVLYNASTLQSTPFYPAAESVIHELAERVRDWPTFSASRGN